MSAGMGPLGVRGLRECGPVRERGSECAGSWGSGSGERNGVLEKGQVVLDCGRCPLFWGVFPPWVRGLAMVRGPGLGGAAGSAVLHAPARAAGRLCCRG